MSFQDQNDLTRKIAELEMSTEKYCTQLTSKDKMISSLNEEVKSSLTQLRELECQFKLREHDILRKDFDLKVFEGNMNELQSQIDQTDSAYKKLLGQMDQTKDYERFIEDYKYQINCKDRIIKEKEDKISMITSRDV